MNCLQKNLYLGSKMTDLGQNQIEPAILFSVLIFKWVLFLYQSSYTSALGMAFLIAKESVQFLRGWVRKFCHRCYNFVIRHDRLLYYTLIDRATFPLYNDAKRIHKRNKHFEIDALKDTWGKTNDTFS